MLLFRVVMAQGVGKTCVCLYSILLYLREVVNTPAPLGSHHHTIHHGCNGLHWRTNTGVAYHCHMGGRLPLLRLVWPFYAIPFYIHACLYRLHPCKSVKYRFYLP